MAALGDQLPTTALQTKGPTSMLNDTNARYVLETIMAMYPDRHTALLHSNPFELLIAVILSAQTTDEGVNRVTPDLFAAYPTAETMAAAEIADLIPYIQQIGLYRNKAKYIQACAAQLVEEHGGQVPAERKALEALPGVGRKTASVVLSNAFNIPAFAVDTHIHRIAKHHHLVEANASVRQVEDRVCALIPAENWLHCHQAMIQFGRQICTARKPHCQDYPELYAYPDLSDPGIPYA